MSAKNQHIRKLIDLDRETVKRLRIQAIELDFDSVKEYMEAVLIKRAGNDWKVENTT